MKVKRVTISDNFAYVSMASGGWWVAGQVLEVADEFAVFVVIHVGATLSGFRFVPFRPFRSRV